MIYLQLFVCLFEIGLMSFGGGYVAIPLIQRQIVELRGWLTATEFTDVITIAEMTPGPIAINAATFVGARVAGVPGAIVATLGCVLPSCVIVLALAKLYYKYRNLNAIQHVLDGLRPAVVAMIASAGVGIMRLAFFGAGAIGIESADWLAIGIAVAGFIALKRFKAGPMWVMGGAGAIGLIAYLLGAA